jgi:hypothetical protein
MIDLTDITTGRTADSRQLGRVALALAVLAAALTASTGGALAAPARTERVDAVADAGQLAASVDEPTDGLQIAVREANEEYIAVEVYFPDDLFFPDGVFFPNDVFLGADRFVMHDEEGAVSLPEETEGLAQPVEVKQLDERAYLMYFSTESVDPKPVASPETSDEEVRLGLGVFTERTVAMDKWDTATVSAT